MVTQRVAISLWHAKLAIQINLVNRARLRWSGGRSWTVVLRNKLCLACTRARCHPFNIRTQFLKTNDAYVTAISEISV